MGGASPRAVTADVGDLRGAGVGRRFRRPRGPPARPGDRRRERRCLPARRGRSSCGSRCCATNSAEPCIDELEVLSVDGRNVARRRDARPRRATTTTARSTSSRTSTTAMYGNKQSWISNQIGGGWVQLELPEVEEIEPRRLEPRPQPQARVHRSAGDAVRNRRVARRQGVEARRRATSIACRPTTSTPTAVGPITARRRPVAERDRRARNARGKRRRCSTKQLDALTRLPKAYAGQFVTPGKTPPVLPRRSDAAAGGGARRASLTGFGATWQLPADAPEPDRRRALADWIAVAGEPAHGPRDRQPALALPLRHRHRRHAERLWRQRRASRAIPSCSTGWRANSSTPQIPPTAGG